MLVTSRVTKTGGRDAATRRIPPQLALAVGKPENAPPAGWQWSALTDLARLESGHTPSRKHPEYWGGDVPWISIGDARSHDGLRIDDTEEKTNELGIENSSARVLPTNTVCLSRTASVGYVVVTGRPMATSQDFVNWVCSKQLDHNFLKYLFIAEDEGLLRFASGAVHQTIYFPEVKAFHICHPPLAEQQRIVGVLDQAFAGLATAQAHAEKNLQNARALFESHLQSVFTQKGEGWVETKLDDVCGFQNGFAFKSSRFKQSGSPLLRISNIQDGKVDAEKLVFFDAKDYRENLDRYRIVAGDLLIAMSGATTGKLGFNTEDTVFYLNQRVGKFEPSKKLNKRFLYHFLSTKVEENFRISAGAAQPNLSTEQIKGFVLPLPPIDEQERIVEALESLATETQRLESLYQQKRAALAALKKSLLHQAFNGEL